VRTQRPTRISMRRSMLCPSRILARLRLPIAAAAAVALLLVGLAPQAFASPDGAFDAAELELGDHTEDVTTGDFTVRASASSPAAPWTPAPARSAGTAAAPWTASSSPTA